MAGWCPHRSLISALSQTLKVQTRAFEAFFVSHHFLCRDDRVLLHACLACCGLARGEEWRSIVSSLAYGVENDGGQIQSFTV